MLPLPEHALPALYMEAENHRKAGEFREAEQILLVAWDTARAILGGPDLLGSVMLELGELYRYALFSKDGPKEVFGRAGIHWMREQGFVASTVAFIVGRYFDLGQRAESLPRPRPSARDIIAAISADDRTETLWLVSQAGDVLAVDEDDRTVLSWAAQRGWPEIVKAALTIGSTVDPRDHLQRSPISYAAENGHAEVLGILLENGALPMLQDSDGRTPLSYAASGGCARVTEILLSDRRVTVLIGDEDRRLPLHWAAIEGHDRVIEQLLEHEPEKTIDKLDKIRFTPLKLALFENHQTTAQLLVRKGAKRDLLFEDNNGFWQAIEVKAWDRALFLLRHTNQGISEPGKKKVAVLRIVPQDFHDRRESDTRSVIQDTTLEDEVITCVYDAAGERMALTVETVQHVAAKAYKTSVELCERGDPDRTAERRPCDLNHEATALGFLLNQVRVQAEDLEGVAQAAAKNTDDALEVMKLLLDMRGAEIEITEEILWLAAGNTGGGNWLMSLLLGPPGARANVTERVVRAAAENTECGSGVMSCWSQETRDLVLR